ncbi:MAG: hypothetical protein M1830_000157 [Pleopsidium flavum]|nr:MAG: hypothetical protein M1830_000157 [Pleopsidium flavum]
MSRTTNPSAPTFLPSASTPDIWKQMSYTPPRGPCAHKPSVITPSCACLRFMIHPLKASSSFDCDGCGHHASFHKMENRAEDEVVRRWRAEEIEEEQRARVVDAVSWKRRRVVGQRERGGGRAAAGTAGTDGGKRRSLPWLNGEGLRNAPDTDTAEDELDPSPAQLAQLKAGHEVELWARGTKRK